MNKIRPSPLFWITAVIILAWVVFMVVAWYNPGVSYKY
jgi:hypothetical protein